MGKADWNPLDGPFERVRTAQFDLQDLRSEFVALFQAHPYSIDAAEFDATRMVQRYRASGGPAQLPLSWGVAIGHIVHDLRAALDGLAWQLALLNGPNPFHRTSFPVFLRGRTVRRNSGGNPLAHFWNHNAGSTSRDLQSLAAHHVKRIEELQPYKRGNGGVQSPLWRLSELNNADKHRVITVTEPRVGSMAWSGIAGGTRFFGSRRLHHGAIVAEVNPIPEGRSVTVFNPQTGKVEELSVPFLTEKIVVAPDVRFGNSCGAVAGLSVIPILREMIVAVERVLQRFESEF